MCGLVGQYGVYVAVAQAGLIKAQVFAQIIRIQYVVLGMAILAPCAIIAYTLLILLAQCLTVQPVTTGEGADAYRCAFNLPLLKKPRTRR